MAIDPVCIGDGVDTGSLGLLSTLLIPSVIGLLIWVSYPPPTATIATRELTRPSYCLHSYVLVIAKCMVLENGLCNRGEYLPFHRSQARLTSPSLRPKPLGRSFWAFLFPHVPLIPSLPSDVSDAGRSPSKDAELFPSDEQLSQRVLWICTLIVAGWTVLALAGFLPLYMVSTPCLAHSAPSPHFTGAYSALQDMSLLRLLQLLDAGQVTTTSDFRILLSSREIVDGKDAAPNARIRLIIATVLAIVLGLLPVLWKILKEFNRTVSYRERWTEVRCQGLEMGWLSARHAPGFVGWGEKRLKDYLVKIGLGSNLDANERNPNTRSRRRRRAQELNNEEKGNLEIDVQSLFSIWCVYALHFDWVRDPLFLTDIFHSDTTHLALLIDERDEVLENLEIAETKYIQSFRLSTPDPSIADWEPPVPPPKDEPQTPPRPEISRPRPLMGSRRRRRGRNPAFGSSSLPPTSYVMPSQFYKITELGGITGGEFADPERDLSPGTPSGGSRQPSFSDSVSKRIIGSRFQEVNRNSMAYGRLPLGSPLRMDDNGQLGPINLTDSPVPMEAPYAPNQHTSWDTAAFSESLGQPLWLHQQHNPETIMEAEEPDEDWHDIAQEDPEAFQHAEEYPAEARRRPRPPRNRTARTGTPIEEHRETFPLRNRDPTVPEEVPPPHLRLQPRQPFVRPLSGVNHDKLGEIYADINHWRWKLKVINAEIAEVQRESYNDIADGARIKGWLMIGRGLRYLPGMQLIEGRAKEDIRWDELQNYDDRFRKLMFWVAVIMVGVFLAVGCEFCLVHKPHMEEADSSAVVIAVAGLAVAAGPDVAHYFPFLLPMTTGSQVGAGVATCLAAAVAAILFITIACVVLNRASCVLHRFDACSL